MLLFREPNPQLPRMNRNATVQYGTRAVPSAECVHASASGLVEEALPELIKERGFTDTLKALKKGRLPAPQMMTVHEGVVEELPSGMYDAALKLTEGLSCSAVPNARIAYRQIRSGVPQAQVSPWRLVRSLSRLTAEELVRQLAAAGSECAYSAALRHRTGTLRSIRA